MPEPYGTATQYIIPHAETKTLAKALAGIMDCISAYLYQSKEGKETEMYGYALHSEVTGTKDGKRMKHTLTHPASDGTVEGWEELRAYTRNVGIPLAVATELIAKGHVGQTGIVTLEAAGYLRRTEESC
ncbi:saccharopine dehydrogenase-like NADP-dependent oxidoreductase [Paenibacillus sacheonensis]|nr:saccharopine dehydrogenase-like NADP-dependent oxidoreductase [Paenibacillus sacheonensis]